MRLGELVGRSPDVHPGIMENQVLKMDELASEPHARGDIYKVSALPEALSEGATRDTFVQASEAILRFANQWKQSLNAVFAASVSH
jgi:hypothetical protein